MRINHVTHNISRDNVEAARSFYSESLGLEEVPATLDPAEKRLIWYRLGSHQLHLSIREQADTSDFVTLSWPTFDRLIWPTPDN